jgi:hypothetical protein
MKNSNNATTNFRTIANNIASFKTTAIAILVSGVLLTSCSKETYEPTLEPVQEEVISNAKTTRAASITSVSAAQGFTQLGVTFTNNSFAGYNIAEMVTNNNPNGSLFTINGSGFGTQGSNTIVLEKLTSSTWGSTSSYTTVINSWTSTQIKVYVRSSINSEPITSARFKIVGLSATTSPTFKIVPNISTRQYQQCTWHASKRSLQNGFTGTNLTYAAITTPTNAYYVPTAHDVLSWGTNVHQAYIESVATSVVTNSPGNTITTYVLTISEANMSASFSGPVTATTTVKVKSVNGVKSFVTGFSLYKSGKSTGAIAVKIQ